LGVEIQPSVAPCAEEVMTGFTGFRGFRESTGFSLSCISCYPVERISERIYGIPTMPRSMPRRRRGYPVSSFLLAHRTMRHRICEQDYLASRMRLQSPDFRLRNPQSEIRNPAPPIPNSKCEMGNPQSRVRNPQSGIRVPQSAIRNPGSAIRNPQSEIRNAALLSILIDPRGIFVIREK